MFMSVVPVSLQVFADMLQTPAGCILVLGNSSEAAPERQWKQVLVMFAMQLVQALRPDKTSDLKA